MTQRHTVLIFGASEDPHVDRVRASLERAGSRVVRLDVDTIPHTEWCHLQFSGQDGSIELHGENLDVSAVYYRRLAMVRSLELWKHIPEAERQFAAWEAEAGLFGMAGMLAHVPWINHYSTIDSASNKPLQLRTAQRVGLSIPSTVVTNCPQVLRDFYEKHHHRIIYKPVHVNVLFSDENSTGFVYTSRVLPEHIAAADRIRATPGIFQEEVQRKTELRVMVVDDDVFCVEVTPADPGEVDWRRGLGYGATFRKYELSVATKTLIITLMKSLNLRYGALDFIVDKDGRDIFLEVNPQGAYAWLEDLLDIPVTAALTSALQKQTPQRRGTV